VSGRPRRGDGSAGSLPAESTTFVGRRDLLAHAVALMGTTAVVTLTGPGGAGKSRLALRLAERTRRSFPDGAWWVDLAGLTEPELVDQAVAAALGVRDQSTRAGRELLIAHVRDRRLLIVLDNCEHLVNRVRTVVSALITHAPGVRVVATSRIVLGVVGEQRLPVPPMSLPGPQPGSFSARALDRFEALHLLAERAVAHNPSFAITDVTWNAAVELVRRLDGIPLAIELAAARLRTLSIAEIVERLDQSLDLLSRAGAARPDQRHHTLRGVMDWSYGLCSPAERLLWARLSVFAGDFDLDAVEAVCTDDQLPVSGIVDWLDSLVSQSVVSADTTGSTEVRYRLLETLRQYGHERLREMGTATARLHRQRHAQYFRQLAVLAADASYGSEQVTWLSRLSRELPNVRRALEVCSTQPDQYLAGLEAATTLAQARFWFADGTLGEGRMWLNRMLERNPEPTPLRATALAMASVLALLQGEQSAAQALEAQGQAVIQECGDLDTRRALATLTYVEGTLLWSQGEAQSVDVLAKAREMFNRLDLPSDRFLAGLRLAIAASTVGDDPDRARVAADDVIVEAEGTQARWAILRTQYVDGLVELRRGHASYAAGQFRSLIYQQREIADNWGPMWNVQALAEAEAEIAGTAGAEGIDHYTVAAALVGASARMREQAGVVYVATEPMAKSLADTTEKIESALGAAAFARARQRGYASDWDDVLALVVGGHEDDGDSDLIEVFAGTGLTERERQIALMAGNSQTNPEIAAQLFVSARTVETHVRNTLRKLGLRRRVQLAAWLGERLGERGRQSLGARYGQ
jgi:predicted ATPase/DNA-binding CsgD family transcriptional regulator